MDTDLPRDGRALGVLDLLGLVVGQLDCPPLKRHPPGEGAAYQRDGELADRTEGDRTLVRDEPQHRAVNLKDYGIVGFAKARRARRYLCKYPVRIDV